MIVSENVSLLKFSTFGIDAKAFRLVDCQAVEDVAQAAAQYAKMPYYVIGGGSNTVFLHDYQGTIIRPRNKSFAILRDDNKSVDVKVGAGMAWDDFVAECVAHSWYGVENLSGIPGNVGAAPVQNIGAYGSQVADALLEVVGYRVGSAKEVHLNREACCFGYRDSIFKNELKNQFLISEVIFRLQKSGECNISYKGVAEAVEKIGAPSLRNVRKAILEIRASKLPDPKVIGNCGSFFKNPVVESSVAQRIASKYNDVPSFEQGEGKVKLSAAWLIDKSGARNVAVGGVALYDKQPLVLINKGNATADDLRAAANEVVERVKEAFGITLEREVIFVD